MPQAALSLHPGQDRVPGLVIDMRESKGIPKTFLSLGSAS